MLCTHQPGDEAMEYRSLGQSGVRVSTLCLGAMTFGEADESYVYGQDGLSERVIGRWLQRDGRRDEVVLATKFRFRMSPGENGTGASRLRIMRTVEQSLRRLQTDRIDLYQIHMQDLDTPEEETLRALDDLVRQGKVLYLGASNYAAYRLMRSLWISDVQHLSRFVALQAQYSLLVRDLEREHVPLCREYGLGILPWSPLAGGFLAGKYRRDQAPPPGTRLERWADRYARLSTERNWRILEELQRVAREAGASEAQVALAWLLRKPTVTSVIFGARSEQQVDDNLRAAEIDLGAEELAALDEASALELGYPYDFIKGVQGRW
jgi:aryl-alcohol dehydrogenase-like predicted oxidoreductase